VEFLSPCADEISVITERHMQSQRRKGTPKSLMIVHDPKVEKEIKGRKNVAIETAAIILNRNA
jgi:hypothetical protein